MFSYYFHMLSNMTHSQTVLIDSEEIKGRRGHSRSELTWPTKSEFFYLLVSSEHLY